MPPRCPEYPEYVRNAEFYADEEGYSQFGEHLAWVSLSDEDAFREIQRWFTSLCRAELGVLARGQTIERLTPNVYVVCVRSGRKSYRLFFFEARCRRFPEIVFTHCEVREDWGTTRTGC